MAAPPTMVLSSRPRPLPLRFSSGVALAGVIILAAGLRFTLLGRNSVWFDEAWVVWVARHGWRDILTVLRLGDAHPPLYYFLMKAWIHFAGAGEVAIRFPSACLSVLSVACAYALARRFFSEPTSLLSAFLIAVSPFEIMAGQEARMLALLGLLALASTLALVVSVARGGPLGWCLYAVLAALTMYTQYLGAFVLGAHGLWVAWWERRHLRPWIASAVAAAILYAPWMPSLWYQTVHGNGWPYSRAALPYPPIGDILGLFAFGGSRFEMGTYFFPGSRDPLGQGIILSPFLGILWCGVASLASNPRALALIGFPLALPVVVMGAVYTKFTFYPRWFSFLFPFYAMLFACGMVAVAGGFRRRRDVVLALLTIGTLVYSVPVLARYFIDPEFQPYPWRAAAELVRRQARPGDFFLYVNKAAEISFRYYFREPHLALTLSPVEAFSGTDRPAAFTDTAAGRLARQHPRVWLIATPPFTAEMQTRLLPIMTSAFRVVGERTYPAIWVTLLEAKPPAPP